MLHCSIESILSRIVLHKFLAGGSCRLHWSLSSKTIWPIPIAICQNLRNLELRRIVYVLCENSYFAAWTGPDLWRDPIREAQEKRPPTEAAAEEVAPHHSARFLNSAN